MAMIKIFKGHKSLLIPSGAYSMYASSGWSKVAETDVDENTTPEGVNVPTDENGSDLPDSADVDDDLNAEDEDEDDVEYVDPEELAKKDLKDLDREELEILADYKGAKWGSEMSDKQLRAVLRSLE